MGKLVLGGLRLIDINFVIEFIKVRILVKFGRIFNFLEVY